MQNHPILFGILAVLVVLFFLVESRRSGPKISPNTLGLMVNNQQAKLIDVRDAKDFNAGHISGSLNIPFSKLKEHLEELRQISEPLIIICNMGTIAGSVVQQLDRKETYRLDGGIVNWRSAGLPLTKPKTGKTNKK